MKKIIPVLLFVYLLASCNIMESDSDSDSSSTSGSTSDSTTLTVQVSPYRNGFGLGGAFIDLSSLDYALILTDSKDISAIQSRVSAGGSMVKTGTFSSTVPLYQDSLDFSFENLTAGDYYLVFMIDYNDDGIFYFDNTPAIDTYVYNDCEMVFLGEYVWLEVVGGGDGTVEHLVLPTSANVPITSGRTHSVFFNLSNIPYNTDEIDLGN